MSSPSGVRGGATAENGFIAYTAQIASVDRQATANSSTFRPESGVRYPLSPVSTTRVDWAVNSGSGNRTLVQKVRVPVPLVSPSPVNYVYAMQHVFTGVKQL